jgi:hypothetical protein
LSAPIEKDPALSAETWIARFVSRMVEIGGQVSDAHDVAAYAKEAAPTYLVDRAEYVDPEEAADTDISYWEE